MNDDGGNSLNEYTIYCIDTGEIIRNVQAHDDDTAIRQLVAGEGLLNGWFDHDSYYVLAGRVRKYTEEETARYRNKPNLFYTWNVGRRVWEDTRPAAEIRASEMRALQLQIAEIESGQGRAMREAMLAGDTMYLSAIDFQIAALRARYNELKEMQ